MENYIFRKSGPPGGCQNGTHMKPHGRKDFKGEAQKGIRRANKTKNVAMMCQCEAKRVDLGRLREPKSHPARQNVLKKQTTGGPSKPFGRLELGLEV